jgi:hypothetical protein
MAQLSRRFLIRVVRYLTAEPGIRQFLDVGTGLPTMQNTHEVTQQVAPDARIAYVDNDPMVLAHARALLADTTAEGVATYVHADYHEPERILAKATKTLDFSEPIAVMFMGVMGYGPDLDRVRSIVRRMMDEPRPAATWCCGTAPTPRRPWSRAPRSSHRAAAPRTFCAARTSSSCFAGLTLVQPGMVQITRWRPDDRDPDTIEAYGAVGRKS